MAVSEPSLRARSLTPSLTRERQREEIRSLMVMGWEGLRRPVEIQCWSREMLRGSSSLLRLKKTCQLNGEVALEEMGRTGFRSLACRARLREVFVLPGTRKALYRAALVLCDHVRRFCLCLRQDRDRDGCACCRRLWCRLGRRGRKLVGIVGSGRGKAKEVLLLMCVELLSSMLGLQSQHGGRMPLRRCDDVRGR